MNKYAQLEKNVDVAVNESKYDNIVGSQMDFDDFESGE